MKHSLRAFRHRDYRLFFSGQLLSLIGTWIQQLATGWLVYRLTGSAWLLGVTAFASQIAMLVLAPIGGLRADRVDRRKLLLATQILALAQALALGARLLRAHRGLAHRGDGGAAGHGDGLRHAPWPSWACSRSVRSSPADSPRG